MHFSTVKISSSSVALTGGHDELFAPLAAVEKDRTAKYVISTLGGRSKRPSQISGEQSFVISMELVSADEYNVRAKHLPQTVGNLRGYVNRYIRSLTAPVWLHDLSGRV